MARCFSYLIVLTLTCFVLGTWAQLSPYSLQTAVDELHHWDAAKFPLNAPPSQPNYYRSALGSATDQDYWDDDFLFNSPYQINSNRNRNRHKLTKELAKYLEKEQGGLSLGLAPFDDFFDKSNNFWSKQKYQKRGLSYFRQQNKKSFIDNAPSSSVFRERDSQTTNNGNIGNSELTQQFLHEIEETQAREREQRYKSAIRHLLDNYQPQDNNVDNKLFDEQKRMRVPPYYMLMQKKRSYPVLPWLPYNNNDRKKRFPVSKRSTKRSSTSLENGNIDKTDEKVEKELSELFGISNSDAKKKRSTDDQTKTTTSPQTAYSTAMNDMRLEMPTKPETNATEAATKMPTPTKDSHHTGHNHGTHESHEHQHEHKHNKRSNHHSGEDEHNESEEEEEEESEEHGEHDEHEEEEDDEDFGDEEDEERKKKRDVSQVKQVVPGSDNIMKRKKKSIQWSKYFGLDRKKKALQMDKKFL